MDVIALLPDFGNFAYTLGAFLVAILIIVAVHEYGHYIVGRWTGIGAEVFSLGMGPVIWSRTDRRGTRWQLAALPIGGYVKFLGDANVASVGPSGGPRGGPAQHDAGRAALGARADRRGGSGLQLRVLDPAVLAVVFSPGVRPTR